VDDAVCFEIRVNEPLMLVNHEGFVVVDEQ
jgi:hypothetical protein